MIQLLKYSIFPVFFLLVTFSLYGKTQISQRSDNQIQFKEVSTDSLIILLKDGYYDISKVISTLTERLEKSGMRNKVNIYKELGEYYHNIENLDTASLYFSEGNKLAIAEELHYYSAFFYLRLGMIENTRANFQEALLLLGKAKEQVLETEAYELESDIFRNTGNIYWGMGIYDKALDNYLRSLETANLHNLTRNIASATNNIGNVYQAVKDYTKARDYYERAYELAKQNDFKWIAAISANNIGDLLNILNKPDSSIFYFTLSFNILKQLDSKFYKGIILFNIGEIYLQIDSIDLARDYFFESLDLANQSDDKLGIVNCYLKIG